MKPRGTGHPQMQRPQTPFGHTQLSWRQRGNALIENDFLDENTLVAEWVRLIRLQRHQRLSLRGMFEGRGLLLQFGVPVLRLIDAARLLRQRVAGERIGPRA